MHACMKYVPRQLRKPSTYIDRAVVSDDLVGVHHIHERLYNHHLLHTAHVKPIHLEPCKGISWRDLEHNFNYTQVSTFAQLVV